MQVTCSLIRNPRFNCKTETPCRAWLLCSGITNWDMVGGGSWWDGIKLKGMGLTTAHVNMSNKSYCIELQHIRFCVTLQTLCMGDFIELSLPAMPGKHKLPPVLQATGLRLTGKPRFMSRLLWNLSNVITEYPEYLLPWLEHGTSLDTKSVILEAEPWSVGACIFEQRSLWLCLVGEMRYYSRPMWGQQEEGTEEENEIGTRVWFPLYKQSGCHTDLCTKLLVCLCLMLFHSYK